MANVTVLQWWDSADAFLESKKELRELLVAWSVGGGSMWEFQPFSDYLARELEPVAATIAAEFAKAHMAVEVVVFWCVMRLSGLPYLTLDFCVKEESSDARACYQISRRDVMLSGEESMSGTRSRVERWLTELTQKFTGDDPAVRLAVRELGCAFSRRRTVPAALQSALSAAGSRRAAR